MAETYHRPFAPHDCIGPIGFIAAIHMTITRRTLLGTALALPCVPFAARAEDAWPSRLVRLISPYGPGGSNDISLRLLAEELGRSLHQQFIVENKPGAGTRIANDTVAHAPGDGYTLLYVAAPYATAEALFGKLTYERRDLQPVAMIRTNSFGFAKSGSPPHARPGRHPPANV